MADTLIIVPTKGRPTGLDRLVRAIWATATDPIDILVLNSPGDAVTYITTMRALHATKPTSSTLDAVTVPETFDSYSGKLAHAADAMRTYVTAHRFIGVFNDDHEPITTGWDRAFKTAIGDAPFGLAFGPDDVWGRTPTAPLLTSSLITALGWIALPGLHHILIDNVWLELAEGVGTAHFLPDTIIRHHHVAAGQAEWDATYAETQANEPRNQQDRETWWTWQAEQRAHDIEALKALA